MLHLIRTMIRVSILRFLGECNHPTGIQGQAIARGWVPASSRVLILYLEFTEAGYQDILAGFQGGFGGGHIVLSTLSICVDSARPQ